MTRCIDTLDRLEDVEGRKYIILITSGRDSFSKHTLDQTLKKVQASKDIVDLRGQHRPGSAQLR